MNPPYENNVVYAVAAGRKGLVSGYVSAVFAQVSSEYASTSTDPDRGQFFMVGPDDNKTEGGGPDRWEPFLRPGELLALPEDDDPLIDIKPSDVLSKWADRESAWEVFQSTRAIRRQAGLKGARTRREKAQQAQDEADRQKAADRRAKDAATPLGRLKKTTRGLGHAFRVPARNGRGPRVYVQMELNETSFRKLMELREADPVAVEEFLAWDGEEDQ